MPSRTAFLRESLSLMGKPYLWCGKGPDAFDCSGLVTYSLYRVLGPDWRGTMNTTHLWDQLPPTDAPIPGDLAFYGSGPTGIDHVMILGPLGMVFGAAGGDHTTVNLVESIRRRAAVRVEELVHYRPGFRAYRSLGGILTWEGA